MAFKTEREGQIAFFDNYKIPYLDDDSILVDNTDGVYNGNLFEFKLHITNPNKVLLQAIKYLSKMRIKGESIPAAILLVDLNDSKVYQYSSINYIDNIQKIYSGSASKDNEGFIAGSPDRIYDYSNIKDSSDLKHQLKNPKSIEEQFVPIDIDENCIVGWAERYYKEVPNANKGDFLGDDTGVSVSVTGEIREPRHFKGLINPYKGITNEKFKYLMDCLNDRSSKKDLGAFYTPAPYAKKAAELVEMAVDRALDAGKKDYVIIDRCVDGDTEYFNGTSWKKMRKYIIGEKVLIWDPSTNKALLETPKHFISKDADEPFYHYVSDELDMCLSASHDVAFLDPTDKKIKKAKAEIVFDEWENGFFGFSGLIPRTFEFEPSVEMNDTLLRIAAMIHEKGRFLPSIRHLKGEPGYKSENDIYEVIADTPKKIERARYLLNTYELLYNEIEISKKEKITLEIEDGILFRFRFPFDATEFLERWTFLTASLKASLIEELVFWNGKEDEDTYRTNKREIVHFLQMIAHSGGRILNEGFDEEADQYVLSFHEKSFSKLDKEGTLTIEQKDRKYCFRVSTGFLILKRNGKIFITGNCAGAGALEEPLKDIYDRNGDSLISHAIVSTYEYYEYKVLNERVGDLVREIIPPTEADVVYENGKVSNADAMSQDFIENPIIKRYLDDESCAVILFENPPYRDMTVDHSKEAKRKENQFVAVEAKKFLRGTASNDLSNLFTWSGFHYYLRQPTDSYVVFSPIKYWKTDRIISKDFIEGFLFNREHFHATPSAIACVLWGNEEGNQSVNLKVYDIEKNCLKDVGLVKHILQCNDVPSKLYDKTVHFDDSEDGICCEFDGTEHLKQSNIRVKKLYNSNIIGYLKSKSYNFDAMNRLIVRCGEYDAHGCFIRKDNYLKLLPLWVSKLLPIENWWDKGIICTTSDGGDAYTHDADFLKSCLIYTCLSNQNKCLTFDGSDGRHYQNELCFDKNTIASSDLEKMDLDEEEKKLISLWKKIFEEARETGKCNPEWTYGVYQITKEINTYTEEGIGKSKKRVYDHPQLNGDLDSLRVLLKEYYKSHITEKMFKYELIK